ncbi:GNAT family acetyltransferase [Pseudoalteromonas undina]|jgi:hypothetical protein|uniref:GNAT family N-acetyltransferase n=1 Tax=Pseudoalteromonas undina TaxID=43660 RepID=UPI0006BB143A|nr:GNAT family N-acetyltransferase [Pseudoalteromonas undina]KPH90385.1 GNAT family acetyltransferase [Pseudoalteromonas undina]
MYSVKRYEKNNETIWNEFVSLAKNGHFFFHRKYLEYHEDRFLDYSLMIFDDKDSLIALLPANIAEETVYSHQGLTFGGLITKTSVKQIVVINALNAIVDFLSKQNVTRLVYKAIPSIYHIIPSDEDLYALFRVGAKLVRRDVSSSINLNNQLTYSKGRKWLVKKAKSSGAEITKVDDIKSFWKELNNVLYANHNVSAIHSLAEIEYLISSFPNNISCYATMFEGEIVSGAVIYDYKGVAHTQYLFNNEQGRNIGGLDLLIDHLVKSVYISHRFFDFGISNEQQGQYLNEGLIAQKEGFGARAISHEFYEITI